MRVPGIRITSWLGAGTVCAWLVVSPSMAAACAGPASAGAPCDSGNTCSGNDTCDADGICRDGVQCAGIQVCAAGRLVRVGVRLQDATGSGTGVLRVVGTFAPVGGSPGDVGLAGETVLTVRRRKINPRAGHTTRVTLRPNRLGRTLLSRLGVLRVRLVIEVTDRMNRLTTATELVGLVDEDAT